MAEDYNPAATWHPTITVHEDGDLANAVAFNEPLKQLADRTEALNQVPEMSGTQFTVAAGTLDSALQSIVARINAMAEARLRAAWADAAVSGRFVAGVENALTVVFNRPIGPRYYGKHYLAVAPLIGGGFAFTQNGVSWTTMGAVGGYAGMLLGGVYSHGKAYLFGSDGEIQSVTFETLSANRRKTSGADVVSMVNHVDNDRLLALDTDGVVWTDNNTGSTFTSLGQKFPRSAGGTGVLSTGNVAGQSYLIATWQSDTTTFSNAIYVSTDKGSSWATHMIGESDWRAKIVLRTTIADKPWIVVGERGPSNAAPHYMEAYASADLVTWTKVISVQTDKTGSGVHVVTGVETPGAVILIGGEYPAVYYDGANTIILPLIEGSLASIVADRPAQHVRLNELRQSLLYIAFGFKLFGIVYVD